MDLAVLAVTFAVALWTGETSLLVLWVGYLIYSRVVLGVRSSPLREEIESLKDAVRPDLEDELGYFKGSPGDGLGPLGRLYAEANQPPAGEPDEVVTEMMRESAKAMEREVGRR